MYPANTPVRQGSPVYPSVHGEQKLRWLSDFSKVSQSLSSPNALAAKPSYNHTHNRTSVTLTVEIPSVDSASLYQPVHTGLYAGSLISLHLTF